MRFSKIWFAPETDLEGTSNSNLLRKGGLPPKFYDYGRGVQNCPKIAIFGGKYQKIPTYPVIKGIF